MARSGEAAAILAHSDGFSVMVSDIGKNETLQKRAANLERFGIFVELGEHSEKIFDADMVVLSPGVDLKTPIVQSCLAQKMPVVSEVEFAFRHEQGKVIAITGSNGKSTTATLIAKIFSDAGVTTFFGGNIGTPYSTFVTKTSPDSVTILELSSFQLEAMNSFRPYISVLLNLTPDHLDRYSDEREYYEAKFHIFDNQTDRDFAVLWADQPEVAELAAKTKTTPIFFSAQNRVEFGADVREGHICRNGEKILHIEKLGIPGPHNLTNALSAVCTTILFNLQADSVAQTLQSFTGIEHRLERFFERDGILYINDSKATNADSVKYALLSFERPLVLIMGGYDKGTDFYELRDLLKRKAKAIVFNGANGHKMAEQLGDTAAFSCIVEKFDDAVQKALSLATRGDVVLLSPGCASYDQFKNYEHRGRHFKEFVVELLNKK
jgi:UDP-N-acetylmuramoylalanine--D-glutamate ligase